MRSLSQTASFVNFLHASGFTTDDCGFTVYYPTTKCWRLKSGYRSDFTMINNVCAEAGLSRPTVSRISNVTGYVTSTETVEVLCRYFGCSPGYLLTLVEDETDGQSEKHEDQ